MTDSAPQLDVEFVRQQFPAFSHPDLAGWAHLENAGGSYVPHQVIDKLNHFFTATKVQPYGNHGPARAAGEAMDRSRALLPATLNADADEVHYGPSTSMNTYVLARALRHEMSEGDEVVVTNQDHEANIGSWRRLADSGIVVRQWSADPDTGLLDIAALEALVGERTRLVALTHASNIAATINPVESVVELVHSAGGRVAIDGVSYAPHAAIDVEAIGCDFYFYSAYKTYGPHVGVMYTRADSLAAMTNQAHFFKEADPTERLSPAGPDHAELGALSGVVDYYEDLHAHHFGSSADSAGLHARIAEVFDLFAAQEQSLMEPLLGLLNDRDGVRVIGATDADHAVRAPTIAFTSDRSASAEIVEALGRARIGAGHGDFYARRLVEHLGIDPDDGVVRLSMVHYNTVEEVGRACDVLDEVL